MKDWINFCQLELAGNELSYIEEVLRSGKISGDGPFARKCETLLAKTIGCPRAILTTSCTDALEMAALLVDLKSGDEFIVPSFTFVSTANALALRGARPVFVDVRRDTLNLDENLIEKKITKKTKAIVVVHYAGVAAEMDKISAIAAKHGLPVIEDNAHGLFGTYRGRPLGSFGSLATQSFHETKNITCGEGGALIINDPTLIERAEILRDKGTNRAKFFRGEVDKYSWADLGSSFLPSEILAAFLMAQLERSDRIQKQRKQIWESYAEALKALGAKKTVQLPSVPAHCGQAFHMFYLLLPNLETRTRLIEHLKSRRIHSVFHYQPLHLSQMGATFGGKKGDCPVTEDVADRLLRLPFHNHMDQETVARVAEEILAFFGAGTLRKAA